ncbi:hypothetical protein ACHAWF_002413, partial [Thalassiosira exigua]
MGRRSKGDASASVPGGSFAGDGTAATVATTKSSKSRRSSKSSSKDDGGIKQPIPSFHRSHSTPKSQLRRLRSLSAPHVRSFDYFLDVGLVRGVSDIVPFEVDLVDTSLVENRHVGYVEGKGADALKFWLEDVKMGMPTKTQPSGLS